ncbi:hypothetical protein D3C74_369920 [compost metagenome]
MLPPSTGPSPRPSELADMITAMDFPRRSFGMYRVISTIASPGTEAAPAALTRRAMSRTMKWSLKKPKTDALPSRVSPVVNRVRIGTKSDKRENVIDEIANTME